MAAYATARLDHIEELSDAGTQYRPIRHHLGITAFGATAWVAHLAGEVVVNEHDEDDPTADEELFLVLYGHALFEIDGHRVDAPAGQGPGKVVFQHVRSRLMGRWGSLA